MCSYYVLYLGLLFDKISTSNYFQIALFYQNPLIYRFY